MILSDLERWDARVQIFWWIAENYTLWPRMTKFGMVIQVLSVSKGSATPPSWGQDSSVTNYYLNYLGPPMQKWFDLQWRNLVWWHIDLECVLFPATPPILRGRGPSIPKFFGTSYVYAHRMRTNNQFLHGDQARCDSFFAQTNAGMGLG